VRDGEIVGEGATGPYPEGPHAEVAALHAAGERARGATAYSTLEPCNHYGNTPPCTDALIDAGVERVVVAVGDPDPLVQGAGYARLSEAGIKVVSDVARADAERDLAAYLHHRRYARPFVIAKFAMSLDGRVAAADGSSQWISSQPARADAHELRADSQAIVVGSGTAIADRPSLTVRDVDEQPARPPLRVLLDSRGRAPAEGPLFDTSVAPTLVITTAQAPAAALDAWRAAGADVELVPANSSGEGADLDAVFVLLAGRGVLQALVEGGGALLGAVVEGGFAQRIVAYMAPTVLGADGIPAFGRSGPRTLADAQRWRVLDLTLIGGDVRLELAPEAA
jgi:diaminohydroxyphosphoribosylaminopyrimidine deaminase/5-amino-6-(5-phosphoribosylamino)uracil reductase